LADLHQYVEGTYTIFPEKKKAVEIPVSEARQISLFDIWAQEKKSKEHSTTAVVEESQKQAAKYSRNVGDYLYLEDDRLYKIERVTDSLIYLKDMERPAWAARVIRPNQYDAELEKNPLNDYLLAGQESALKDSRCVYKECLYTMLDAVQQSEIYPYLRDRDVDADEAEKELRNKIDELLEQNAKTAPLYLEASQNWENFKDWLVEDIFQRTYTVAEQQAEALKEKLAAEKPTPEASISFYVAECAEFPVMGEFHDNLTLEQALEVYDKIPAERMNGIKSIGFSLEDGSIYSGMFDLMVGGEVQAEVVNHIQHYRESPLVQKAISDMKTLLEKRQASKELEERPNTRQSVREALKNRKKAQEQQSNQEQAKPKKAKKKGEMEL
jgi:quinol monooxygenase YgiN